MMEVREIELRLLDVAEHEQRFDYEGPEMDDLVASIRRDGILEPLIVRAVGVRYVVVNGHRRRVAAERAGLTAVPCTVEAGDASRARRVGFIVNLFRKDPTPVELAVAIAKAVDSGDAAVEEMASGLHRSVDWVKRQLAMLEWPEDVLQQVHAGRISIAAAANLAAVTDLEYRRFLLDNAVANGATARTTAAWLQAWEAMLPAQDAVQQPPIEGGPVPAPMVPQTPCFCCGIAHRVDELSHVPICTRCLGPVRRLGTG